LVISFGYPGTAAAERGGLASALMPSTAAFSPPLLLLSSDDDDEDSPLTLGNPNILQTFRAGESAQGDPHDEEILDVAVVAGAPRVRPRHDADDDDDDD
jgi:hypothetical protein